MAKQVRKIREDIDYGDYPERMDPSIQKKLERGETPFSKHKAMPSSDFDQIVASKRFKDAVDKFVYYSGGKREMLRDNPMQNLVRTAYGLISDISRIEQRNKRYLENLAIDLVKKTMNLPEGTFNFDANLTSFGAVSASEKMSGFGKTPDQEEMMSAYKEKLESEGENHIEDILNFEDAIENFDLEKAKRRFINSLIQGAAKKGHYMFELVRNELENLSPDLTKKYGLFMSILDYLYWLYPEQMMQSAAQTGSGQAGNVEIIMPGQSNDDDDEFGGQSNGDDEFGDDDSTPPSDKITIKAVGSSFPILLHELIKGVYQVFGSHGLPKNVKTAEMVVNSEDTLIAEIWDIRLGPIFWEKFLEAYPDELFEDDKVELQNYLISKFVQLSASEFLEIAKLILSGNPRGKAYLQNLVNDIVTELNAHHAEESYGSDEDDDEDLPDVDFSQFGF
jgi:hypothetical protein